MQENKMDGEGKNNVRLSAMGGWMDRLQGIRATTEEEEKGRENQCD